jgi:UDP-glucose 4-epimerase
MSKVVLITGVAGFLGRTLALYFFERGWEVVGVDNIDQENLPVSFLKIFLSVNLPDPLFIQLLEKSQPIVCIHCAGGASVAASIAQPINDYKQGPALTYYILNSLHDIIPQCNFILLSSAAVYGNPPSLPILEDFSPAPISIYGFNKWQSEIICREFTQVYGQPTAIVRIFSAYGPGLQRQVIWDICKKAITEDVIHLHGRGNESRDFVHSYDIAQGIEKVITFGKKEGEIYNLACGHQISISDLATLILGYLHLEKKEIIYDKIIPLGDPLNWQANIHKICRLGFSPTIPFEGGLNSYVTWFLSNWNPGQKS